MPLTPSKRTLAEAVCLPGDAGRKLGEGETALLGQWLHEDPACPSRVLLAKVAQTQSPIAVSIRHLNRLRVKWTLNRSKGRPRQAGGRRPVASGAEVVALTPHLACVGVHLFADWLDHQESFAPVVARLIQAIQASKSAHPDDDFAL
jgi:hypothetical protein